MGRKRLFGDKQTSNIRTEIDTESYNRFSILLLEIGARIGMRLKAATIVRQWIVTFLDTKGYPSYAAKFLANLLAGIPPDHGLIIEAATELNCPPERLMEISERFIKTEETEDDTIKCD